MPADDPTPLEVILALVAALAVVFGGYLQSRPRRAGAGGGPRERLRTDLEIMQLLPKEAASYPLMTAHVDAAVERLVTVDDKRRRDPFGTTVAVILLLLAAAAVFGASRLPGASWLLLIPAVPLAVFGVVGLALSAGKSLRDERGNRITGP